MSKQFLVTFYYTKTKNTFPRFTFLQTMNTSNSNLDSTFEGKNILIIGASSGIGHALAEYLQSQRATLFTASRTKPKGITSTHTELDVTKEIDNLQIPDVLHGLVYCAGSINLKPFARLKVKDFESDFQINVIGAVKVIQHSLKSLKKANSSSIVLFSTVASKVGMNFHASIATAKSAVEGLAQSLAAELASQNTRVNVLAPSLTNTPLAKALLSTEDKKEASNKRHPLGRIGTAEDLASATAFLLSDESSWITGQIVGVDGGMGKIKLI